MIDIPICLNFVGLYLGLLNYFLFLRNYGFYYGCWNGRITRNCLSKWNLLINCWNLTWKMIPWSLLLGFILIYLLSQRRGGINIWLISYLSGLLIPLILFLNFYGLGIWFIYGLSLVVVILKNN